MGRALAKQLAQKGANIVIVARDKQKLEDALKYISVSSFRTILYKPISCICVYNVQMLTRVSVGSPRC